MKKARNKALHQQSDGVLVFSIMDIDFKFLTILIISSKNFWIWFFMMEWCRICSNYVLTLMFKLLFLIIINILTIELFPVTYRCIEIREVNCLCLVLQKMYFLRFLLPIKASKILQNQTFKIIIAEINKKFSIRHLLEINYM